MTVDVPDRVTSGWCTTPYGYASFSCSPAGIRCLDIFETKKEMLAHERYLLTGGGHPTEAQEEFNSTVKARLERYDSLIGLPLDIRGTPFQHQVWGHIQRIPSGTTCSYRELAQMLGAPGASRAVANACARNTVALAIPCHRVVRSDNSLGGYRWGTSLKEHLLALEGVRR
jgi:O-6-methylguanine DNA methyltransferase